LSPRRLFALALLLGGCSQGEALPKGRAGECASCHLAEYEHAKRHVGSKPMTCAVCHGQNGWHPTFVDHEWALTGKHEKTACRKCHDGSPPVYKGTSKLCIDCHRDAYKKAKRHENKAETCEDCHTTSGWKPTKKKGGKAKSDD